MRIPSLLVALLVCACTAAAQPVPGAIAAALEGRPVDPGGYRVQFAPGDRRGSRYVDMTYLAADGRFRL